MESLVKLCSRFAWLYGSELLKIPRRMHVSFGGFLSVFDLFFPLRYDTYKNCTLSRSFEKDSYEQIRYLRFLKSKGITIEVTEHKAVYNTAEMAEIDIPYPEADEKNLFVRDDKRQNYYLITVNGDRRVDLNKFRREHQTKPLTFSSVDELEAILAPKPGSVTPFGLLNDKGGRVHFFLGGDFLEGSGPVGVHPNENTATVWLKAEDLLEIIREHGNRAETVKL